MSKTRAEMVRFVGAGLAGLAADVGVLHIAQALGMGPYLGRVLSFLCAVWVTWQINRRFTFAASITGQQSVWREWWKYLAAMLGGGAVNYAAYVATLHWGPPGPWLPTLGVACGSLAGMTVNFTSAKWLVFNR